MAIFSVPHVSIVGLAASVPATVKANIDFEPIPISEREIFIKTTGIAYRRVAKAGTTAADLCQAAAEKLLNELKWDLSAIHVLVFVTQTPDYITPATATLLQEKLGLPKSCLAFDVNLGCSGYVYGLSIIASLLGNMPNAKGLLLVGDVSSACTSPLDKSTAPIFSDAGSATALENSVSSKSVITFNLGTDGKGYDAIIIPSGGYRNPITAASLEIKELSPGIVRNDTHLIMNGIDVFNFASREVTPNVNELLQSSGIDKTSIDHFVFHQANLLINETIRRKLALPDEKVPYSLKDFGNTSSASIPITMVTQLNYQLNKKKQQLVLSGFGVGLSWGSAYLQQAPMVCLPLIDADC